MINLNFRNIRIWQAMILMCFTVLVISCSKDDDTDNYILSNQEFVTRASSSNNFEIAAGALAKTKGNLEAVRHYGEHMVTDHTAAGLEMKNLASQKGWVISEQLREKEQANIALLTPLTGVAFDKEFARIMVDSHQDAVALFELASANMGVSDGDLRNFATTKLPTLKAHLQEAIALKTTVNP
jgi:putative membrane protein